MIYKCRPAGKCYHDDPYYAKDVIVPDYIAVGAFAEREAAALFADDWCHRRSEYGEMDVQVLTAEGWVTFDVQVRSVPEFVATRKKGVPPVPDMFRCNECDKRYEKDHLEPNCGVDLCRTCFAEWAKDDAEGDE